MNRLRLEGPDRGLKAEPRSNWLRVKWPSGEREEMGEGWVGTQDARVSAPRATLTLLSCSPNFPRASIPRYTHAKYEPIIVYGPVGLCK